MTTQFKEDISKYINTVKIKFLYLLHKTIDKKYEEIYLTNLDLTNNAIICDYYLNVKGPEKLESDHIEKIYLTNLFNNYEKNSDWNCRFINKKQYKTIVENGLLGFEIAKELLKEPKYNLKEAQSIITQLLNER